MMRSAGDKGGPKLSRQDQEGTAGNVTRHGSGVHWMEEMVRQAQSRGDFDNLPGKGRPLQLSDDDPYAGEDAKAYKILKDAGFVPEWIELRNQIVAELDWLRTNPSHPERVSRIVEVNVMIGDHNRQIPTPNLAIPKVPKDFGLESN